MGGRNILNNLWREKILCLLRRKVLNLLLGGVFYCLGPEKLVGTNSLLKKMHMYCDHFMKGQNSASQRHPLKTMHGSQKSHPPALGIGRQRYSSHKRSQGFRIIYKVRNCCNWEAGFFCSWEAQVIDSSRRTW